MNTWRHAAVLLVAAGSVACGGQSDFRKTGGTYAPRGPGCDYRVIRNRVIGPYEELGVIDIDAFSMKSLPDDEERFRKVVGPTVCGLGGDAVIPQLDVYGHWTHGTIIRLDPRECEQCKSEGKMSDAR